MQRCIWDGFFFAESGKECFLHVFPASSRVRAPYPVSLRIRAYSAGQSEGPLVLNGARLHQMDQVNLSESFKSFSGRGLIGLEIVLVAHQPSIDLHDSSLFLEVQSSSGTAKYRPKLRPEEQPQASPVRLPKLAGDQLSVSYVLANPTNSQISIPYASSSEETKAPLSVAPGQLIEQTPEQAAELCLDETELPSFALYRERREGSPVGVEAI